MSDETMSEYQRATSTIRGRMLMARAAADSAEKALNEAIANGVDVDAPTTRHREHGYVRIKLDDALVERIVEAGWPAWIDTAYAADARTRAERIVAALREAAQ